MAKAKDSTDVATTEAVDDLTMVNTLAKGIDFVPETWEEVAAAFEGELIEFEGSPWKVIDKAELVGVPFVIADVRAYYGKFDNDVVAVMALVQGDDNEKVRRVVFNDGSTGIKEQVLHMVRTTGRKAGILCAGGLRASDYTYTPTDLDGNSLVGKKAPDGTTYKETPATTYYVA